MRYDSVTQTALSDPQGWVVLVLALASILLVMVVLGVPGRR
jgi:hypothetical protein